MDGGTAIATEQCSPLSPDERKPEKASERCTGKGLHRYDESRIRQRRQVRQTAGKGCHSK